MPQKTRVGNDRSQSTTDVARRRNRNEKLYKAGTRSSMTLAAQNADISEIELALSTPSSRSRYPKAAIHKQHKASVQCYRITASARSSTDWGIARLSAFAVFRL